MFSKSSVWRNSLGVIGLVAVAWTACFHFPVVWLTTGIGEADRPFMDLYGLLAAMDAMRAGIDPFQPNSFDPYHRPHVYTEWWLSLRALGLGRGDNFWLGSLLVGALLGTAVAMVRPRSTGESVALILLLLSPAMLLAVNRANNDIVVLLVVSLGLLCFRDNREPIRGVGIGLFALAAVLKYYPLVTLVLLLEMRKRRGLVAGLALYLLVLVIAWPGLQPGLKSAARAMPGPEWIYAFGAPVFLRDLGIRSLWGWLAPALLLVAWAAACAVRSKPEPGPEVSRAGQAAEREFICGAAMLVGLFFLGSSYVYKLIFAVWLLPWLVRRAGDGEVDMSWRRVTLGLLLAVVWLEGTVAVVLNLVLGLWSPHFARSALKAALLATQACTWALVACLLRFLLIHVNRRTRALWAGP